MAKVPFEHHGHGSGRQGKELVAFVVFVVGYPVSRRNVGVVCEFEEHSVVMETEERQL